MVLCLGHYAQVLARYARSLQLRGNSGHHHHFCAANPVPVHDPTYQKREFVFAKGKVWN